MRSPSNKRGPESGVENDTRRKMLMKDVEDQPTTVVKSIEEIKKSTEPGFDIIKNSHHSENSIEMISNKTTERCIDVLPKNVLPIHYNLILTPGLPGYKFKGQVEIDIIAKETTDFIEMNSKFITVESVSIRSSNGETVQCTDFNTNDDTERLKINLNESLKEGSSFILCIHYTGVHNDLMVGFYKVLAEYNGVMEYTYATQFESNFCRRALPCWDEPGVKCTFNVTLRVPVYMTALSNMNSYFEQIDSYNNIKMVKFNTTPKMSTYLLAIVVGRYNYIEKFTKTKKIDTNVVTKAIRCRVYAPGASIKHAEYALECGCEIMEFFEEYFKIPYPLPKMDQVPISNFRSGAMENWGLITYREVALLLDPKNSGTRAKHLVSIYVGHEFAHQWFGNLVTMKWWNDLWLNEGFATFAGTLVLDKLYPEWTPFLDFIIDELYPAFSLDSMKSTHPIDVPVYSSTDIPQIFDAISYSKGASIIRMLFYFIGEEKFRDGLHHYLKTNSYSNAATCDLWFSLKMKSEVDVNVLMDSWVSKPGYPIITVTKETYNEQNQEMTVDIMQQRYYSLKSVPSECDEDETIWWIPLTVITHENPPENPIKFIFNKKKSSITFSYKKTNSSFYKFNALFTGLYHVCMTDDNRNNILKLIAEGKCNLGVEDKLNLLSGFLALAKSGEGTFSSALDTLVCFKNETNYYLLKSMAYMITSLSVALYRKPAIVEAISKLAIDIFGNAINDLGYEKVVGESDLNSLKRNIIISILSFAKYEPVLKNLKERFDSFVSGNETVLDPDLREIAYISVLKNSIEPQRHFDSVVKLYKSEQAPDQKMYALNALGAVNDTKIVEKLLNELIFDETFVKQQDIIYVVRSIVSETPSPMIVYPLVWNFLKREWDELVKRFDSSPVLLGRILSLSFSMVCEPRAIKDVKDWISGEDIKNSDNFEHLFENRKKGFKLVHMQLNQAIESLEIKTKWVQERSHQIEEWLVKSNYMHICTHTAKPDH